MDTTKTYPIGDVQSGDGNNIFPSSSAEISAQELRNLNINGENWAPVDQVTRDILLTKANKDDIPTDNKTLTNGAGYITNTLNAFDYSNLANKPTIPSTTEDLENTSGFITKLVSDLENYYNKTKVNELISTIPKFSIEVVPVLPTENISKTTIYLVKSDKIEDENIFTEYIYTSTQWEKLGAQKVDLSGYAQMSEIQDSLNKANTAIQKETDPTVPTWAKESNKPTYSYTEITGLSDELNKKYVKPENGIAASDLSSEVQLSLEHAESALQSFTETDPTVPEWAKKEQKPTYGYSEITGLPEILQTKSKVEVNNGNLGEELKGLTINGTPYKFSSSYILPQASADKLGGIKADEILSDDLQPVRIDPKTGKLFTKAGGSATGGDTIQSISNTIIGSELTTTIQTDKKSFSSIAVTLPSGGSSITATPDFLESSTEFLNLRIGDKDWTAADNKARTELKNKLNSADIADWAKQKNKPVYTATEIGLGSVNNTSDLDKPISKATQAILDQKQPLLVDNSIEGKLLKSNAWSAHLIYSGEFQSQYIIPNPEWKEGVGPEIPKEIKINSIKDSNISYKNILSKYTFIIFIGKHMGYPGKNEVIATICPMALDIEGYQNIFLHFSMNDQIDNNWMALMHVYVNKDKDTIEWKMTDWSHNNEFKISRIIGLGFLEHENEYAKK